MTKVSTVRAFVPSVLFFMQRALLNFATISSEVDHINRNILQMVNNQISEELKI